MGYSVGNKIVVDASGNSYLVGSVNSVSYTAKYDSNGIAVWTNYLANSTGNIALALDSAANVYVIGSTASGISGTALTGTSDMFLVKYSNNGVQIFVKQLGKSGLGASGTAILVDLNNNVYVTGLISGVTAATGNYMFVAKYSAAGTNLVTSELSAPNGLTGNSPNGVVSSSLAINSNSNIFVSGNTFGDLDGNTLTGTKDMFVAKYNSSLAKQ
jgi:hypothetical protein